MGEIVGNFIFVGRSVVKNFLTTDFYIEYNRDLTNLNLEGRVLEIWGVGLWENVYNLFNNSGRRCGIIEI